MRLRGAALFLAAASLFLSSQLFGGENQWTPSGPGSRVLSLTSDRSNPGFLYALTDAGIYRSGDLGVSWNLVNSNLRPDRVKVLVADPVLSGRVTAAGCGVLQSDDFGASWAPVAGDLPADCSFTTLGLDPYRPYYLFAGGPSGFYRTDFDSSGQYWTPIAGGIFVGPAILAVSSSVFGGPSRIYAAPRDGGFFYSDDRGTTWMASASPPGARIIGLTVFDTTSPQGKSFLVAQTDQGLYETNDAGKTWEKPENSLDRIAVNSLVLSDRHGRASYAATGLGVYRDLGLYRDLGQGWAPFSEGLPESVPIASVFTDTAGRRLCAASVSGDQLFVYRYGNPTIVAQNPDNTVFLNRSLGLRFAISTPQPGDFFLDLESSDPAAVGAPTNIYPWFSDFGGFGVDPRRATGVPVTIRARVPRELGGSETSWTVTVLNPPSTASILSPSVVSAGSSGFKLRVYDAENGRSFVEGSTITWNGSPRASVINGPGACPMNCPVWLEADIGAADIATAGYATVTVINPAPGGGASRALSFTIAPGANRSPLTRSGSPPRPPGVVRP